MKRVTENGTRKVVFAVEAPGDEPAAQLTIVRGDEDHVPYLWIGAPNDGPCIGTVDARELRNLARVILQEVG